MYRLKLRAIAMITACLLPLSCTREAGASADMDLTEGNTLLSATVSETDSRTMLRDGNSVCWGENDCISVFTASGGQSRFRLEEGAGSRDARFRGNMDEGEESVSAFFPWSETVTAGAYIGFDLPSKQVRTERFFGAAANPMYARMEGGKLVFRSICGALTLQLSGTDKVGKIIVRDLAGTMLWGRGSLSTDGSLSFNLAGGSAELELDCGEGVQLGAFTKEFTLVVPPGAFASGFSVYVYSTDGTLLDSFSTVNPQTISRASLKPMKARAVTHDLSAEQSANCYLVYEKGSYKFKAVKGNGNQGIAAVSASVLWESDGTANERQKGYIIEGTPSVMDGYIHFDTAGNCGNALIAAHDANGDICWSWHIWIPATKVSCDTYSNGTGVAVADRNLGAITAEEGNPLSNGLLYQWGRKDPFPGSAGYQMEIGEQAVNGTIIYSATSAVKGTVEYACAHPTEFLHGDASVISNQDWVAAGNNTNWGESKTVYDPCPPGYRVAGKALLASLAAQSGDYGITMDGKYWYPLNGYRWISNGTLHSMDSRGYIWSCNAGTNQGVYTLFNYSDGSCTTGKTMARSGALGVRCCTDDPGEEIPSESEITKGNTSYPEFSPITIEYKKKATDASYLRGNQITVEGMNWMDKSSGTVFDRWGGLPGVKPDEICSSNPAGFWRTGKYRGRHVMVDPDGNVAIIRGVNGVTPDPLKATNSSVSNQQFSKKFGSDYPMWAKWANKILTGNLFNFFSLNANRITRYLSDITEETENTLYHFNGDSRLSQVYIAFLLRTFSWDYRSISGRSYSNTEVGVAALLYDPDYLTRLDAMAKDAAAISRDKPEFMGWYLDNELQFRWAGDSKPGIWLRDWLVLEEGSDCCRANAYAKKHAQDFMREKYGVEPLVANITPEMEDAFLYDVVSYYYKTATEAIRRYDPYHLILGTRLHGYPCRRQEIVKACAEYCDVISVNTYSMWEPDDSYFRDQFSVWTAEADKPFMVSEFYIRDATVTFEGQTYSPTAEGGGWYVKGQADRGRFYQGYTRKLLSYRNCIGWQWFQMTDDHSASYNGWNNKGLVNPAYEPYENCLKYMRESHENIYQIMDYYL